MADDENGDRKRQKRGEALRGRLGKSAETSKTEQTVESEETSERSKTSKSEEMSLSGKTSERTESKTEPAGGDLSKSSGTPKMSSTTESTGKEESEETIRDRKNVNMYLPEADVQEMQIRFDELNARHRRVHGRAMEKNRDYYPAIVRAALNETSLEEELDLVDE